ncbi:hypothetical protein O3P69_004280 [Scylla paramamosain]|uniref:Uncharacterized protein n=1 Tax=Scylla paramamosain TaxID=85552 RepID=A0AAW0UG22_SCYPA
MAASVRPETTTQEMSPFVTPFWKIDKNISKEYKAEDYSITSKYLLLPNFLPPWRVLPRHAHTAKTDTCYARLWLQVPPRPSHLAALSAAATCTLPRARGMERLSQCTLLCFATNITLLETHAPPSKPVSSPTGRADAALPCGLPPLFWSQGRLPGGALLAMQEEDGPIHPLGKQVIHCRVESHY